MIWLGLALAQVVEFPEGPTLASIRVRAMGGTCVALAESAACQLANPAAVVVRRPEDDNSWSLDSTIQLPLHPVYRAVFGGDPPPLPSQRILMQLGANMKANQWGVGLHLRQERWDLSGGSIGTLRWSAPLGVSFGQGGAAIAPVLLLGQFGGEVQPAAGVDAGGVWAPPETRWRFGLSGHSPMRTVDTRDGRGIRTPWRLSAGVGYGLGLRNVAREAWFDRVRTAQRAPYLQFFGELELIGDSGEAVGLLDGEQAPIALVGRVGGEADVWRERLKVRAGTYAESARGSGGLIPHVTAGATVHLFTWLQGLRWRAGGVLDWAPDAPTIGVGLETW